MSEQSFGGRRENNRDKAQKPAGRSAESATSTENGNLPEIEEIDSSRTHNNIPQVAELLVDTMLTAKTDFVREAARESLLSSADPRAAQAFQLERCLREISKGGGMFGNGPENPDQIQAELVTLVNDPIFVDRMIEYVTSGRSGSYYVAHALRETPLAEKQEGLRERVLNVLEGEFSYFNRNDMWALPYALDPQHPETVGVLIKAVEAGPSYLGNFDSAAIGALGDVGGEQSLSTVVRKFYESSYNNWNIELASADSVKRNLDESMRSDLTALIDGSLAKSAWVLAGKQGYRGLGRVIRTANFLTSGLRESLHNKRTQAALALVDVEPELARRVFLDVTKGGQAFNHKCHFFAASDANRALQAMA